MKAISTIFLVLILTGCHPFGVPTCKDGITYWCYDTICYPQPEVKCKDPKELK